ncbi:hypothetical protein CEQ90_13670 [Lewinellaceae bacterium SD302]|nr:hypothetical protein CEQ90_13670 [Lewinellaceae bacterium SD302]
MYLSLRLTRLILVWFSVCSLFGGLFTQADAARVDSLEAALQKAKTSSEEAELLLSLGDLIASDDPDKALQYGRRLLRLETKNAPSYGLAYAYRLLGDVFITKGITDSSIYYHAKLDTLLTELPDDPDKAQMQFLVKRNLATVYNQSGRDQTAIALLYESLAIPGISSYDSITSYNTLGNAFFEMSRYDESIATFQRVLEYARREEDKKLEAMALVNSTMSLDALGRYDLSEEYLLSAIAIIREINEPVGLVYGLRNLAFLYSVTDRKQKARDTMWAAIQQSIDINNLGMQVSIIGSSLSLQDSSMAKAPQLVAMALTFLQPGQQNIRDNKISLHPTLAHYFSRTKEYESAIHHAKEGLLMMNEIGVDSTMDYLFLVENLATAQQQTGRYREAAANFRNAKEMYKAIKEKNDEAAFAQTAASMELAENRLSRERAEAAVALEKQASAANTRLFGLAAIGAAIILGILVWAYLRSRRDARHLSTQKALVDQSLSEKEVLLREIHHRVKNNLQIISALLQKQARRSESEDLKEMIRDGQERIQSMALIHENLYRSEQLSGVSIKQYLRDLTDSVSKSQGTGKVAVDLQVEDEHLDLDTAIPLGLILNELITNAYKYAFPDNRRGAITVEFEKRSDGQHLLRVSDDGVGLPSDYEIRQRNSLGLNLVKGLVGQLEGSIDWIKLESGTSVAIQF